MSSSPTRSDCSGCHNDFYNSRGGCWHFEDAKVVQRIKIHRDAVPPFRSFQLQPQRTLSCWQGDSVTAYEPSRFTPDGRWK